MVYRRVSFMALAPFCTFSPAVRAASFDLSATFVAVFLAEVAA